MNTFKAILVAISILATPAVGIGAEQPNATKAVSLEDRLKTGLRARRPEEFAFIEDVVSLVQRANCPAKSSTRPSSGRSSTSGSIRFPPSSGPCASKPIRSASACRTGFSLSVPLPVPTDRLKPVLLAE